MAGGSSGTCNTVCSDCEEVKKKNIANVDGSIRKISGSYENSYTKNNNVNEESFNKRQKDRKIKQLNEADKDLNFLQGGI